MTWISSSEAAEILSKNSGREISPGYVRLLAQDGKIKSRLNPQDASTRQFWKEDVEGREVKRRTDRRVAQRVRDKRSGKPGGRPRKSAPPPPPPPAEEKDEPKALDLAG
jgi:hypothetical protein